MVTRSEILNEAYQALQWKRTREKGLSLYLLDFGITPAAISSIAFAAMLKILGVDISAFLTAFAFALIATPFYLFNAHLRWMRNEDAFARWVANYYANNMGRPLN